MKTHGQYGTPEYRSWAAMLSRCRNPNCPQYPDYGGRGITVCDRWTSFSSFAADMGPRPPGLTLDRRDNDGNYEPGNCRWATWAEQANNTRGNRLLTVDGVTMTVGAWSKKTGLKYATLWSRVHRAERAENLFKDPHMAKSPPPPTPQGTGRGPGRPRDPLPERIQVRLTTEELDEWTRAASADGRTLANWMRAGLNKLARSQK